MVAMSERVSYGFAVGRVRVQETTLLDGSRYDRLVRARNREEFVAGLADTFYGRYLAGKATPADSVERMLVQASQDSFAFFARYCLDPWVLDIFRLRADFHNLKLSMKHRSLGTELAVEELLSFGNWKPPQLRALAAAEPKALPESVRTAMASLVASPDANEPAAIDVALDRLEQEMALVLAGPSPFLSRLYSLHADAENLRTFIRVKATNQDKSVLERAFLPGGTIPSRLLLELLAAEWGAVSSRFRLSRYHQLVEEGVGGARQRSLLRMERTGRELELRFLRLARYATFGYEPLVGYYLFRENELANLRQLVAAKAALVPETECREFLAYVE
jgi:V/A-type H+-transporting ATPase subunit C